MPQHDALFNYVAIYFILLSKIGRIGVRFKVRVNVRVRVRVRFWQF